MNKAMLRFCVNCIFAGSLALGLTSVTAAQGPGWTGSLPIDEGRMTLGGAFYQRPMRWLRELDLSEAQQDQIFRIIYERAPAIRDQVKIVRRAHEELDNVARAPSFDPVRAREVAEVAAKALVEIALVRAEAVNRIREILTPEQRARMDLQRTRKPQ